MILNDIQAITQEIARVSEAMRKTKSPYLRHDYGRYRKKLFKKLKALT